MSNANLIWDDGTAYDMFVSLVVLHDPNRYGLRAAWAAGMRSRLPAAERKFLEDLYASEMGHPPFRFIHFLTGPKDGAAVLHAIESIPAAERLTRLMDDPEMPPDLRDVLYGVSARGAWTETDRKSLVSTVMELSAKWGKTISDAWLAMCPTMLDWWAHPAAWGEPYLESLRAYYEVFFAEEERRIRPALDQALERAQEMAERTALRDLLEELSQGIQFGEKNLSYPEIALAPSYWTTPFIYYPIVSESRALFVFGARPPEDSLVPGETVPDALVRTLKALSDPTRLRILRYLEAESMTPTELARRLRLRPPTVFHHLSILRLAGLVQIQIGEGKDKSSYTARARAVEAAFGSLRGFLDAEQTELEVSSEK